MIAPLSTTNTSNAGFPNFSLGRLGPLCVAQPSLSTESDVMAWLLVLINASINH